MPQKIINIEEIMQVRVNNTLAMADKKLLKEEQSNFEKLKDFTFDQEIGYIVCSLLDSKLRAVSDKSMIISYELDSNVLQNLQVIEKLDSSSIWLFFKIYISPTKSKIDDNNSSL